MSNTMVDRLVERLKRDPMGDLVTDDVLREVCREALQKAFFEPRKVPGDSWRAVPDKEPLVVEAMREALRAEVEAQVQSWVKQNHDVLVDFWRKVLDKGLVEYVQIVQRETTTLHLKTALNSYFTSVNNERAQQGLPAIQFPYL